LLIVNNSGMRAFFRSDQSQSIQADPFKARLIGSSGRLLLRLTDR
jgi:hypothetical protein